MSNQEWSLGISRFNCTLLWRLPMQNHSKPSMTEKRRIKIECPIWYSIRLVFVKINIPDIRYTIVRRRAAEREDQKSYWKLGKRSHFHEVSRKSIFTNSSKFLLAIERKLTGWKKNSLRRILKSLASMYKNSNSQRYRVTI